MTRTRLGSSSGELVEVREKIGLRAAALDRLPEQESDDGDGGERPYLGVCEHASGAEAGDDGDERKRDENMAQTHLIAHVHGDEHDCSHGGQWKNHR